MHHNNTTTQRPATDAPTTPLTSRHDQCARRHKHSECDATDKKERGGEYNERRVQGTSAVFFISYSILIIFLGGYDNARMIEQNSPLGSRSEPRGFLLPYSISSHPTSPPSFLSIFLVPTYIFSSLPLPPFSHFFPYSPDLNFLIRSISFLVSFLFCNITYLGIFK